MAVETKFERDLQRFDYLGLDLNRPVDSVKAGKLPYSKNVRSFLAGRVEPRDGLALINATVVAGQTPAHSCRRLNDPANATYQRIIGAGTHLAYGQAAFTDVDSGYSGDPLALVPWKPDASPVPFMYVADRSRMRKINSAGSLHTVGLAAPGKAPDVGLSVTPAYKVVDDLQATTGWSATAPAGSLTTTTRINSTITKILYDSGTTGWACIQPASMGNVGPGCRILINTGGGTAETVTVQETFPGSTSTTIAAIIYDNGATGLCSIVLTTPAITEITPDALIYDSTTGPEAARIIAVTLGPDGTQSIRLATTGAWLVGDTVQVLASFRSYLANTHAPAEALNSVALTATVASGTGKITKTSALDLSVIQSGLSAKPSDYMHISISVSDPTVVTELKVLLNVDITDSTFTQNYYWHSFRPNDLTPAASNLQSLLATRQTLLQRTIIDTPNSPVTQAIVDESQNNSSQGIGNPLDTGLTTNQAIDLVNQQTQSLQQEIIDTNTAISQQLDAGVSQFVESTFRLSDLTRIGTDTSRTLQNVSGLQIVALVTGTVVIEVDSWWIGGGYGPDTGDTTAIPYSYRFRARNPATNVPSNWSPASRYQSNPLRQSVTVTPAQYPAPTGTTLTTADFVLDIERFGGQIATWNYAGTIPNSATPSFADIYDDILVGGNPTIGNNDYQPWPIIGLPVSGTTGIVSGTTLNDSATSFSLIWAPGTRIIIASQPYTIYRVISTSRLETVENMGSQTAVAWQINEPTILAQPLPCLWEQDNVFFACGDPINPGRLYWSNPNSETSNPANYIDVTSPSEPLQNGLAYNIRSYLFSSENMFQILSTSSFAALAENSSISNASGAYIAQKIPNGKGLFSRWFLTREPAPVICFGSRDGINLTTGGAPVVLTDADMYELFPNEGNPGVTVNGIAPPDISAAQAQNLRLAYYDEYLYFDYPNIGGGGSTLVLAFDLGAAVRGEAPGGWLWDTYSPYAQFHYGEEGSGVHSLLVGGVNGLIYQYTGYSDNGTPFSMELTTPSRDQGDARQNKLYGDIMLDSSTAGLNVTATPYFNNNSIAAPAVTVNTASRQQTPIPVGSAWQTAQNISLNLAVLISTSARPFFYIWEPRWALESADISAFSWEISPSTFGMENFKSLGLTKITHVSTVDLSIVYTVDSVAQAPITIPNSGGLYKQTIFRTPVYKGKLYKIRISSSAQFRLDGRDSFIQMKEWASDNPYSKMHPFSNYSLVEG